MIKLLKNIVLFSLIISLPAFARHDEQAIAAGAASIFMGNHKDSKLVESALPQQSKLKKGELEAATIVACAGCFLGGYFLGIYSGYYPAWKSGYAYGMEIASKMSR